MLAYVLLCARVCVCIDVYVGACVHASVRTHVFSCVCSFCACVNVRVFDYAKLFVCVLDYACVHTRVCASVRARVFSCGVCVLVFVLVCMCVCLIVRMCLYLCVCACV